MMRVVNKHYVKQAVKFTGSDESVFAIRDLGVTAYYIYQGYEPMSLFVKTLTGQEHILSQGDWLLKNAFYDYFVESDETFNRQYVVVKDNA